MDASEVLEHSEITELLDRVAMVGLGKLQVAANETIELANAKLSPTLDEVDFAVAVVGTVLGRLGRVPDLGGNAALALLLAGIQKPPPLIPIESVKRRILLETPVVARNIAQDNAATSLGLPSDYLGHLLSHWGQKVDPRRPSGYEDMMISIATSEAVQFGYDTSQIAIRHWGCRCGPMNHYECQVYCGKLLIHVRGLLRPYLLYASPSSRDRLRR